MSQPGRTPTQARRLFSASTRSRPPGANSLVRGLLRGVCHERAGLSNGAELYER
jgi:hypothetical protein